MADMLISEGVELRMSTLYLTEQYSFVRLEGETLRLQKSGECNGNPVRIPLNQIEQVMVLGDITLSTAAMHELMKRRIPIHYLSAWGASYGSVLADWGKNSLARIAQYALYLHRERSFDVARQCIIGKLHNMRTMLVRYARERDVAEPLNTAAQHIRRCIRELRELAVPDRNDDRMHGLGPLFGLEGSGSNAYFSVFGHLLKGEWSFTGRVKRPPTDPINAMLSFGYSLLSNQVVSLIHAVGLDPGLGVLHQPGFGKPALALDLVEAFRPIIVDSVVLTLINTGQIGPDDFSHEFGVYRLKDKPRKTFLERYEARLNEQVQHPIFGYRVSYRRCIELQIRLFTKYAQGEIERYVPFTVR